MVLNQRYVYPRLQIYSFIRSGISIEYKSIYQTRMEIYFDFRWALIYSFNDLLWSANTEIKFEWYYDVLGRGRGTGTRNFPAGKVRIILRKATEQEEKTMDILPQPPGVVIVFFTEETMSEAMRHITGSSVIEYFSAWDCTAVTWCIVFQCNDNLPSSQTLILRYP